MMIVNKLKTKRNPPNPPPKPRSEKRETIPKMTQGTALCPPEALGAGADSAAAGR
ncbi:hypothetical protein FHU41_002455 [Psychromicrobium silvestre]|uniref:Uncharacterized protein n=1 Tax=Psychromicrobium silvestre TaxID=1645614 RepID=A0A7Y9LV56_9MICC|nr:hypothetical protein [Psychromicrobium silvestre]